MAFKRGISMGISAHLSSLGSSLSDRDADKWNLLQKVFYHAELRKLNANPLYKIEPTNAVHFTLPRNEVFCQLLGGLGSNKFHTE